MCDRIEQPEGFFSSQRRMRRLIGCLIALLPGLVGASSIWLPDGVGVSNVPAISLKERKFTNVVRQQYDFSCGSAALATLLTYHYERRMDEQEAFRAMYSAGDKEKISAAGFSLLDMKRFLATIGFQSDGYQTDLATLENAGVPAIALINYRGYRHFVVVKGVSRDEVLLGDPALGLKFVSKQEFGQLWDNGVLFIIKNQPSIGKQHFNKNTEWSLLARAPLGDALPGDSLAELTVQLPRIGDF